MTPDIRREVLEGARRGDRDAFRTVVEATRRLAFNIAWRLTWNAADAEDAAQEIYLRLYRNFERYDPNQPFFPWFRRLATNCVLNWKERQRPAAELPTSLPAPAEAPQPPDFRLRRAISELPPEYQACVTLKYLEDLSVREIADTLRVPSGTVKTWLFRAREALMRKLKPHREDYL